MIAILLLLACSAHEDRNASSDIASDLSNPYASSRHVYASFVRAKVPSSDGSGRDVVEYLMSVQTPRKGVECYILHSEPTVMSCVPVAMGE